MFIGSALSDFDEGRFPDPGLSANNQCRPTLIDPFDQMIDHGDVLLSPLQDERRGSGHACALFLQRRVRLFRSFGHPTTVPDGAPTSYSDTCYHVRGLGVGTVISGAIEAGRLLLCPSRHRDLRQTSLCAKSS